MATEHHSSLCHCMYCKKDISHMRKCARYCSNTCRKKYNTVIKGGKPLDRTDKKRPIIDGKMQCSQCKEFKLLSLFYLRTRDNKKIYDSHCKECHKNNCRKIMAKRRLIPELKIKINLSARIYRRKKKIFGRSFNDKVAFTLRDSIRGNYNSKFIFKNFGYSMQELKIHIERQFDKRMTWDKFLNGEIHIDHIIPISSFDMSNPDEVKACWALSNLRPLWASDNIKKSAKILHLI